MRQHRLNVMAAALGVFCVVAVAQPTKFAITSLGDNASTASRVIFLKGVGAEAGATLEVSVLTNAWYVQDGVGTINQDGSWTYGPVHLDGQGQYNNHTIEVSLVKNGQRGEAVSVSGIVRP